jgi:hypothetical protein
VGDHQRGVDRLAAVAVVLQDELRDRRLDLLGRHDVAADPSDVGLGRLDVALDQLGLPGEDVRLVGEDVRDVGDRDLLGGRGRNVLQVVPGLVVVVERDATPAPVGPVPLLSHELLRWQEVRGHTAGRRSLLSFTLSC